MFCIVAPQARQAFALRCFTWGFLMLHQSLMLIHQIAVLTDILLRNQHAGQTAQQSQVACRLSTIRLASEPLPYTIFSKSRLQS